MQNVFVTGATGFIGSHLVTTFLDRGCQVKCLVREHSHTEQLQRDGVELIRGSIEMPETYAAAITNSDLVIHSAGLIRGAAKTKLDQINGAACGQLADVCRALQNPPRLVYISSLSAAGPPPPGKKTRDEQDVPRPVSHYGQSKRWGEIQLQQRADAVPITVVRPGIVFGPRDPAMAMMFRSIYRYRLHFVVGRTTPPLSLVYVDDLTTLVTRAAQRGDVLEFHPQGEYSPGGYYFAVDDSCYPNYGELGKLIAKSLNRNVVVWPLWRWVGKTIGFVANTASSWQGRPSVLNVDKVREATATSWACTSSRARSELQFSPRQAIQGRLKETADWYLSHGWL